MLRNYRLALLLLDTCLNVLKSQQNKDSYEQSEILLYKAMLLEESGSIEAALAFLDKVESKIVDRAGWREKKAELLLRSGAWAEARKAYADMLEVSPECYDYHRGLQAAVLHVPSTAGFEGCELLVESERYVSVFRGKGAGRWWVVARARPWSMMNTSPIWDRRRYCPGTTSTWTNPLGA
jgi:tetratricopeptide (TPR) repeat protein